MEKNNISRCLLSLLPSDSTKAPFPKKKNTQHKIDTINAAARLRSNLIKRLKSLFFLFSPFVVAICQVACDFLQFTSERNCNAKCNGKILWDFYYCILLLGGHTILFSYCSQVIDWATRISQTFRCLSVSRRLLSPPNLIANYYFGDSTN